MPKQTRIPGPLSPEGVLPALSPAVLLIVCFVAGGFSPAASPSLLAQTQQSAPPASGAGHGASGITFLASNALLAGMGAGISQAVRGGSFVRGFLGGALGGAVAYSGRAVAARKSIGAGLLGRQVGALGASLTRNASEGRPALEHVLFPVGPLNLHLRRLPDQTHLSVKLDVLATTLAGFLAISDHARVDWPNSLTSGVLVFRSDRSFFFRESDRVAGETLAHTIILIDGADFEETLAHERVHLLQSDFAFHVLGGPLEGWLAAKHPLTRRADQIVDLDLLVPTSLWAMGQILSLDTEDRLTEQEAVFLTGG